MESFKTQREFNNKYPTNLFICPNCSHASTNKYYCDNCSFQANNILNQSYEYEIQELNLKEKILPPLTKRSKE